METTISFTLNDNPVTHAFAPYRTLLEVLRDDLGLTGTKEGCGTGDCGACTLLLDGQPVTACLVLAAEVDGRTVTTVEGIAHDGKLTPLQVAFMRYGGTQCGICTSGFVVAAHALLQNNPTPSEDDVRRAIGGNLCRCTGYDKIVRAVLAAAYDEGELLDETAAQPVMAKPLFSEGPM
ncbi:MAG: (2Fe-2S)-binding protein [Chloroflexota bacterium]